MKKKMRLLISTLAISGAMGTSALAGTWDMSTGAWRYMEDNGSYSVNSWISDGGCWYRTDENGIMRTGWYQDANDGGRWYYLQPEAGAPEGSMKTGWLNLNGKWYFLDTRAGGPEGAMLIGWQWIDGKCYYLDPADGGAMAASKTTPDGYKLDASGAWVDDAGVQYYEEGRGISSTVRANSSGNASDPGVTSSSGNVIYGGGGSSGGGSSSGRGSSSRKNHSSSDSNWDNYKDNSVSHAANDSKKGDWGMMSSDERADVNDAINDFKDEYITSEMSDFEKEIKIIEWLVENCDYQKGKGWENATAYSCIINGEAQCAGYADAFLQTAKACGLNVRYVYNNFHAWNLIELDGDWYHVDVTWEDPVTTSGSNGYGFDKLSNKYINLEDSEIRGISYHDEWKPDSIKAKGTKYGRAVVAEYLKTGETDTDLGSSYSDRVEEKFESADLVVEYKNKDQAIEEIMDYLDDMTENRDEKYELIVRFPSKYKNSDAKDWLKVYDMIKELSSEVSDEINERYSDILNSKGNIHFFSRYDANDNIYAEASGSFIYKKGERQKYNYLVIFTDKETGEEIGTQSGQSEHGERVKLDFPEGYNWISNVAANYEVTEGRGDYTGREIANLGRKDLEIEVRLKKIREE